MRSALKWLLFLPVFVFFFLFLKTPVFAADNQTAQAPNQYLAPVTNPNVPQNLHTYTQSIFIELLSAGYCTLVGVDPVSQNQKCLGIDPSTHKIGFIEGGGGLIGATTNLITMTYKMPTSSSEYVNYLTSNFGLTKKAYAASTCANDQNGGAGFCLLKPLTNIWISMRNLVYLLFTIVFIIIGLAIMLRVQIDPRTVMTLENQIPKIIVGILMVTFSLAIAGFLIDIMYVAIYLIGKALIDIAPTVNGVNILQSNYPHIAASGSPIQAMGYLQTGDIGGIVGGAADGISKIITGNINSGYSVATFDLGRIVAFLIIFIILLIAFWISLFRIWIALIMAYVMILLDIVFAPFWFIAGLLPGGSLGFGPWFKDIGANLAVFPATIAMFALAIIFANIGGGGGSNSFFSPPMVGGLTGDVALTLGQVIAFGFIFMTPQALTLMKAAFKAPKFNLGPVFAPAGAAVGVIRGGLGAGAEYRSSGKAELEETGFRRVLRRRLG